MPFSVLPSEPAISSEYYVRVWGIENGLSQGTIPCMAQTPDGYIWMGTQESLSRFDGARFVNFNTKNTPILKSSWVESLALSNDQELIIGTWRGGIYQLRGDAFTPLPARPDPQLLQAVIFALAVSPDGTVWAGTSDGLFSIHGEKTRHYGPADGFPVESLRSLLIDGRGVLWIGSEDQGLWSFNKGTFSHFSKENGLVGSRIWALARDGDRGIWIGCGNILTHYDGKSFSAHAVPVSKQTNLITDIACAADGSVWLSLQNKGAWRFKDGKFSTASEQDGLSSNLSLSVMEDRECNIWVGTNGNGVNQLVRNRIRVISRREGLAVKDIWTVRESDDGSLWIGTNGGGLSRLRDGVITQFTLKDGLSSLFITALHQSPRDGAMWIGTEDNGFMSIHDNAISRHRLGASLAENTIYCICEQEDGVMIIGSAAGITFWKDGRILSRLTTREGLTHNAVRELVPGREVGEYWVSTDIGLNLMRRGRIVSSWRKADGLSEDALNGLYLDAQGNLWIGTYGGGVSLFRNGRFTMIGSENGLHNDVIYGIIEDSDGRLWMSSNRGVFAVRKAELLAFAAGKSARVTCFPLGIGDGLRALECNGGRQPAVWLTRAGLACFATTYGVAMLDTRQFRTDEPAPAVIFEQVSINDIPIPLGPRLSVAPCKRNLDIEFTSAFFSAPEKICFQYRLLPFEEKWSERKGLRLAHYTNIPPGDYRFELRSSNRFGIWNQESSQLAIRFRPYFRETMLFRILIVLMMAALAAFFLHRRIRYLEKSKRELEKAVAMRTKELKEAYEHMEQMSLTDPLTQLNNRRYFHNIIDREIRLVVRHYVKPSDKPVPAMGFLMIDIDHFKQINDRHGHLCGDRFLQMISKRFLATLRASDLIVRWGGEEFLILSKGNDFEGARLLCRRLLATISREPLVIDEHSIQGSVSIGFCPFPLFPGSPGAFSWEGTVNLADQALYHAKNSGRDCAFGVRLKAESLTPDHIRLVRENLDQALKEKLIELVPERV